MNAIFLKTTNIKTLNYDKKIYFIINDLTDHLSHVAFDFEAGQPFTGDKEPRFLKYR
jgi:hypothetical protein